MNPKTAKSLIRQADILFGLGLGMMVIAHFITVMVVYMISDHAATVAQVAQAYEGNPVVIGLLSSATGLSFIIQFIALPSMSFASYYVIRKAYKENAPVFVMMLGAISFFAGMLNVTNDMAALVGVMLKYGYI